MARFAKRAIIAGVVALTACSSSGGGSSASTGGSSSGAPSGSAAPPASSAAGSPSVSPSASAISDPCANNYFPVADGATWLYRRTSIGRETPIRQSFERISDAGFTTLQLLPGGGERDLWACAPAGLANVEQHATGPGGGPPPTGTVDFHHFRSRGVTVPSDLSVGSAWSQVVTSTARFKVAGVWYTENQVVTTSYRVVGEESVTTPAGTFQALKVQFTTRTHKTAPDFGQGINLRNATSTTQWWARDVGIVRSIVDTGSGSPTTIVLVAYRAPGAA
jgi:hypothetical protein